MTEEQIEQTIPRYSWWRDAKGRVWVVVKFSFETNDYTVNGVELLELYKGVPVCVGLDAILSSIEKGLMKRIKE